MNKTASGVALTGFLILALATIAFAQPRLQLVETGNAVFTVQGAEMDGTAAIDLVVNYDPALLVNPRVSEGPVVSGAMTAINTNIPGVIRIAFIRLSPFTGAGALVTLSFDAKGPLSGGIVTFTAALSDSNGRPLHAGTQLVMRTHQPVQEAQTGGNSIDAPADKGSTGSSAVIPFPAAVSLPDLPISDQESRDPEGQAPLEIEAAEAVQSGAHSAESEREPVEREELKKTAVYTQPPLHELFRHLKGKKSLQTFTALFEREPLIGFRQEPGIAISDGKTSLLVYFIAMTEGNARPAVSVRNGRLASLKRDEDRTNSWIALIVPKKDATDGSITVKQPGMVMELPLTVLPLHNVDFDKSGKVAESDYAAFAAQQDALRDLNKDGVVDYLDDYIFTGNYLAALQSQTAGDVGQASALKKRAKK